MCKEEFAKQIDRAVFPGMQGGPHDHITAAKAVAFGEALQDDFKIYAQKVIANAKILAQEFKNYGFKVISDGTDNHLMVVNMTSKGLSGKETETILDRIGISVSRSTIPNDPNPPMNPSGVRYGTAALTTRGMGEEEMKRVAIWIDSAVKQKNNIQALDSIKKEVKDLCLEFPVSSL
jgi:glycine hydroxymethyltransferase